VVFHTWTILGSSTAHQYHRVLLYIVTYPLSELAISISLPINNGEKPTFTRYICRNHLIIAQPHPRDFPICRIGFFRVHDCDLETYALHTWVPRSRHGGGDWFACGLGLARPSNYLVECRSGGSTCRECTNGRCHRAIEERAEGEHCDRGE
jgi:hypothetical protein